jgi:hypothetical protein
MFDQNLNLFLAKTTKNTLKPTANKAITNALTPTEGREANRSLFDPIVNPNEKIKTRITPNVTLPRLTIFLPRNKKPHTMPKAKGTTRTNTEKSNKPQHHQFTQMYFLQPHLIFAKKENKEHAAKTKSCGV